MSRRRWLFCGQVCGFLAIAITCNVVIGQYPESGADCVTQPGAKCTDYGNATCFMQGGGGCFHCKGGDTLPNTYCLTVAGGLGCEGGTGGWYCGLMDQGVCVEGTCVVQQQNVATCNNVNVNCTL